MSKVAKRRPPKRRHRPPRAASPEVDLASNGHGNGHSNGHSIAFHPGSNGNGSTNGHTNGSGRIASATIVSSRVLLLNQNYEPLTICTAKRAIVMALSGTVQVVEKHAERQIRSVNAAFDLPTVIRLDRYIKAPRKRVLLNRRNILARDNHRCQYCNSPGPNLTIDHVIARRRGGEDSWENLVTACVACNSKKGNRSPEQAGMRLLKQPKRPDRISFIRQSAKGAHQSWRPYLFMD